MIISRMEMQIIKTQIPEIDERYGQYVRVRPPHDGVYTLSNTYLFCWVTVASWLRFINEKILQPTSGIRKVDGEQNAGT